MTHLPVTMKNGTFEPDQIQLKSEEGQDNFDSCLTLVCSQL